ncbi:lactococcin 972 family bacteriocin [Yinghuangia soli]|uniref:Lactococcin 972 family bacteriocin n=1 Tax=Yinghuangia soli TaxID=2908204 RepID=A0AA41PZR8_9ACTN|nr:lactococcin 972 family bacteriocin [Yinghuangia soli]MCF2528335.1 lactococcin 972 family bacteriocin [Yinghuangia soli]
MAPRIVEDVGGGTWNHGTASADSLNKSCYSNYVHPKKDHSSTAIMASGNDKGYAKPGAWSKASVTAGAAHTCYAYWAVY